MFVNHLYEISGEKQVLKTAALYDIILLHESMPHV